MIVGPQHLKRPWHSAQKAWHIVYKNEIKCQLLDFVLTGDKRLELKEQEKLNNNNDLKKAYKISGTYGNLWFH